VVYLAGWLVHFSLLTQPGPADAFHPTTGRFIEDLRVVHRTMIDANANMVATHPDASLPLTWPLMTVPPYFWSGDGAAVEYLIGNPVVWWGSTLVLVVLLIDFSLARVTRVKRPPRPPASRIWWLLTAYGVSYLPFFRVTRILFLYHYFTPLVLALGCGLIWLDQIGWTRLETARQRTSYYAVMAAAVAGFLLMSPMTYGYSAGAYGEWLVTTIRSWR
jgi:dolichyl-phosphate-mannose--protein O-mannosyl transferase